MSCLLWQPFRILHVQGLKLELFYPDQIHIVNDSLVTVGMNVLPKSRLSSFLQYIPVSSCTAQVEMPEG